MWTFYYLKCWTLSLLIKLGNSRTYSELRYRRTHDWSSSFSSVLNRPRITLNSRNCLFHTWINLIWQINCMFYWSNVISICFSIHGLLKFCLHLMNQTYCFWHAYLNYSYTRQQNPHQDHLSVRSICWTS